MPRSPWRRVAVLAIVAGAVWLPFAGRGLSPDEGGLLVLARQWSPGSSLYGDYFIDRPPLLIALVAVADAAGGGEWELRALGILAAVITVALAGVIGRLAAPASRHAPVLPAATAAPARSSLGRRWPGSPARRARWSSRASSTSSCSHSCWR